MKNFEKKSIITKWNKDTQKYLNKIIKTYNVESKDSAWGRFTKPDKQKQTP